MVAKKARIEWDKLSRCDSHAPWLAAAKEIRETFHVARLDPRASTSQAVAVHADTYHRDCAFAATLTEKRSRIYLNFSVNWGGQQKEFITFGSSHPNYTDEVFTDPCCGDSISRNIGYEKRRLHGCTHRDWGHFARPNLTEPDITAFIKRVADFANITFASPTPVHINDSYESLPSGGHP